MSFPRRLPSFGLFLLIALIVTACGTQRASSTAAVASPTTLPSAAPTATTTSALVSTQTLPSVVSGSATTPVTPTPLATGLQTTTARTPDTPRATEAIATTAPTARATTAATANSTANATAARTTQTTTAIAATTGAATTNATNTRTATAMTGSATAASATSGAGTAAPTTTPVPTTVARGTTEQFLRAAAGKRDIADFVSPTLSSQSGGDGAKLLGLPGTIRDFTVDSESVGADGNTATVRATIMTSAGTVQRTFTCVRQGAGWIITAVG